jgi:hypothetical protein
MMINRLPSSKVGTPASVRPKGSFMNPTASKMQKEVSRQDLVGGRITAMDE